MTTKPTAQLVRTTPSDEVTFDLRHSFLVQGKALQPLTVEHLHDRVPQERLFRSAKELEAMLLLYTSTLFGRTTVALPLSKRVQALFGKTDTPSFFLLESTNDVAKPRFYFVTIALAKHNSMDVLLPRLYRLLGILRNDDLINRLIESLVKNKAVSKALPTQVKPDDLRYYLKVGLTHSTVLLVNDGRMPDLPEVMGSFAGSWQSVKTVAFRKYMLGKATVLSLTPSFPELHLNGRQRKQNAPVSEDYHLENVEPIVRDIYRTIKEELLTSNPALVFNPQRYYVSLKGRRNIAIFQLTKKKLNIVVMNDEQVTRRKIKHYEIRSLKESIQKFWNGPCCTVVIDNDKHLTEVIELLRDLTKP